MRLNEAVFLNFLSQCLVFNKNLISMVVAITTVHSSIDLNEERSFFSP